MSLREPASTPASLPSAAMPVSPRPDRQGTDEPGRHRWVAADWERPPPTDRQQWQDVGLGVLLAIGIMASTVLSRSIGIDLEDYRAGTGEEIAWALAVGLPLCLRRRYPLAVLVVCSIGFIGMQARLVPESALSSVCLFVALYTAGAWGRNRRITSAVRIIVVVTMFSWLAYAISSSAWTDATGTHESSDGPIPSRTAAAIYSTAINVLYFAGAWAFGNAAWAQTRQRAELAERNRELQVERDANARRAVIAERVRIARELHDVVAHHVSVMGVQAGAARRVLDRDPALAERTLTSIESAGRSAVEEMHRLLGVLREGEPVDGDSRERAPAPGLDQLAALVDPSRTGGPEIALTVVGEPRAVPQSVSVSLYRIAQEALTNTVRHAGAARADVRLRYLDAAVEIEVVDDGRGTRTSGSTRTTSGSGMGHIGMRERVAMHGGQLEVGPRPEGGYRVRARFPVG